MEVVGAKWKPTKLDVPSKERTTASSTESRWICFRPAYRNEMPEGVVLYEVHASQDRDAKKGEALRAPQLSQASRDALQKSLMQEQTRRDPEGAAVNFRNAHPHAAVEINTLVAVVGVATAIACVAAAVTPVPGDEIVMCRLFVSAVVRLAR